MYPKGTPFICIYLKSNDRPVASVSHPAPHHVIDLIIPNHGYADHDDVIRWKHFPRDWPFVRRIHRCPVNSPHKGQWSGALMFALICARINDWVNNREAGDLRRRLAHYDVTVMLIWPMRVLFIWFVGSPAIADSSYPSVGCPVLRILSNDVVI